MFELTFYYGQTAIDWTDKVISLGRLTRKTEEEGRIPRTLYFDNFDIEIPLHQTGSLFELSALSSYPDYRVSLKLFDNTVFTGAIDFDSIRFTAAQTVQMQAVSFLANLDRRRWPVAFPDRDLIADWDAMVAPTVSQIEIIPFDRVGSTDFFEKIGIATINNSTSTPLRVGDFIIHPDFDAFIYQIRTITPVTAGFNTYFELVLDRPYFEPAPLPVGGYLYNSFTYKKREFLGSDIYDYFTPPGFPESLLWVNGRKFAQAMFPELPAESIDPLFLGDGPVFASIDLEVATVIAKEDNPIKILFLLLGFQRQVMLQDRSGVLKTIKLANIEAFPDDPFPELPLEAELDSAMDFAWDKRVDAVKVTAKWRGDTVEVNHEREQTGSADARKKTLNIEAVGDAARATLIAAEWFSLYSARRLQAKVSYPCTTQLSHDTDVYILDLDLYSHVRYRDRGWWVSGMEIDIINMSITLELTGLQAFLTQDWS